MESLFVTAGAGFLLGVSLAAPPGPMIAIIAHESVRRGFLSGVLVGFGAMTADAIYLILTWAGATRFVTGHPRLLGTVGAVGALLMTYFAWKAFQGARQESGAPTPRAGRTGFTAALLLGLTNPYQIAWWLSSGLPLIHILGVTVIVGFFLGILFVVAAYSGAFTYASRRAGDLMRVVGYGSAALLFGFAVYLGYASVGLFTGA